MKKIAAVALAVSMLLVSTSGCLPPRDTASVATERDQRLAFSSALAALEVLDELHLQRMRGNQSPTQEDIEWAQKHTDHLHRIRDSLALWRRWLTGEVTGDQGRAAVRDALAFLQLSAQELQARGLSVPSAVVTALAALRSFV